MTLFSESDLAQLRVHSFNSQSSCCIFFLNFFFCLTLKLFHEILFYYLINRIIRILTAFIKRFLPIQYVIRLTGFKSKSQLIHHHKWTYNRTVTGSQWFLICPSVFFALVLLNEFCLLNFLNSPYWRCCKNKYINQCCVIFTHPSKHSIETNLYNNPWIQFLWNTVATVIRHFISWTRDEELYPCVVELGVDWQSATAFDLRCPIAPEAVIPQHEDHTLSVLSSNIQNMHTHTITKQC